MIRKVNLVDGAASMRRDYSLGSLDREDLDSDPVRQFRCWFEEACEGERVVEPNAMVLSTTGSDGQPNARTVLLKAYDDRGFVFFTNYESPKAREMADHPSVCLLFPWLALERQLKIQGQAERISRVESVRYFLLRPRGSRLGAWVSEQSQVISGRSLLLAKLKELEEKFQAGEVPCPDHWGGFRVVPRSFEFWQGGRDRLHDRFEYERDAEGSWEIRRLAP